MGRALSALCACALAFVLFGSGIAVHGLNIVPQNRQLDSSAAWSARRCGVENRGLSFPDTDFRVCECFQCFSSDPRTPDTPCGIVADPCVVGAGGGNPLIYNEWWLQNSTQKWGTRLATDYRIGYQTVGELSPHVTPSAIGPVLERAIRGLHDMVGNAKHEDKSIVIGTGCTSLIAASTYALQRLRGRPVTVFARPPFYGGYRSWAGVNTGVTNFSQNEHLSDPENVVEFVTYPNNPTGTLRNPVYPSSPSIVHDMVYFWPSLVPQMISRVDFDVMLFSMSKLTGHAGSRFGWALVKSPKVAELMEEFIGLVEIAVSEDSAFRALNLIRSLQAPEGQNFFAFIHKRMMSRWERLTAEFANQTRFELLSEPGTFYAWVRCVSPRDLPCPELFSRSHIQGWAGSQFGMSDEYVRLEMVEHETSFDFLLANLRQLMTG